MKLTNLLVLALTLSPASAFAEDAMAAMRAGQAAMAEANAARSRPSTAAAPLSPDRFNTPDSSVNWIPVSFTEGGVRKQVFVRRPDVPTAFHWNSPVYTLTRQGTSNTFFARRVDYTLNYNWGVQLDWTVFPYWYTIHPRGIPDQGIRATLDNDGGGVLLGLENITVVPPTATGESADPALLVTAPQEGQAVTTDEGPAAPPAVAADTAGAPPAVAADAAGSATDNSGAAPATDNSGASPATDDSGAAPATDDSGAAPATDNSGAAPTTDGSGQGPINLTPTAEAPVTEDHREGGTDAEGVHQDVAAAGARVEGALSGAANAFGDGTDHAEAPVAGATGGATGAPTDIVTPGEPMRDAMGAAIAPTAGGSSNAIVDPAHPSAEAMAAHNAERASRDRSNLIATAAFGVWGVAAGAMIFGTPLGAALMGLAMAGAIFGLGHFFGRGSGEGSAE